MIAFILAAGFGTRLGELTKNTPKCLIDIGGQTILEHVVNRLKSVGVDHLVINLHYLPEAVKKFIEERDNFNCKCELLYEPKILGTGGAIKNAAQILDKYPTFFVHNADVYSEINLEQLYQDHVSKHNDATLAVLNRNTTRPLLFNKDSLLVGWKSSEASKSELLVGNNEQVLSLAFTGIQVVSKSVLPLFCSRDGEFSSIFSYLDASRAGLKIRAYNANDAVWIDIGRPENLEEVRRKIH